MPTPPREERAIDVHVRSADPVIPLGQLAAIGGDMKPQHRARIIAMAEWLADSGIRCDASGKPVMRASQQRKFDRRLSDIDAVHRLLPATQSSNLALLRLYS